MAARRWSRPRGDDGMSLAEVLLTMTMLGLLSALVSTGLVNAHKLLRVTEDQSTGLQDVRAASERLTRDIRNARSVLCNPPGTAATLVTDTTCVYHLNLWVDYNSDYLQTADETVTWALQAATGGHYDLVRTVAGGVAQTEARTIVEQVAFTYDYPPGSALPAPGAAHATTVNVNMTYDPFLPTGTAKRTVTFSARLRNVS